MIKLKAQAQPFINLNLAFITHPDVVSLSPVSARLKIALFKRHRLKAQENEICSCGSAEKAKKKGNFTLEKENLLVYQCE